MEVQGLRYSQASRIHVAQVEPVWGLRLGYCHAGTYEVYTISGTAKHLGFT
jgi:hypothetical protein